MKREEAEMLFDMFNTDSDMDYDFHHRDYPFCDQLREEIEKDGYRILPFDSSE